MRFFCVAANTSIWIRFTLAVDVTIFRPLRRAIGAHVIAFLFTRAAPTGDRRSNAAAKWTAAKKKTNAVKLGFELFWAGNVIRNFFKHTVFPCI